MLQAPAADKNKGPILDVLCKYIPHDFNGFCLEIASGTGQHVTHFAQYFKQTVFQPSDIDQPNLKR